MRQPITSRNPSQPVQPTRKIQSVQQTQPRQSRVGSSLISGEQPKGKPIGLKIISVLLYISSGLSILLGILSFLSTVLISSIADILEDGILEGFIALGITIFILLGIFLVGLGIFTIFIARGLWNQKKWARITAIILMSLTFAFLASSIFTIGLPFIIMVAPTIISLTILIYLIFSRKVKEAFS